MPRPPLKAEQIATRIAGQIEAGVLTPGAWLPSERDLAQSHLADRSTVRRALRLLEERGVVVLTGGVGAQVHPPRLIRDTSDITARRGDWRGFHLSAEREGREPFTTTSVLEVEVDSTVARWLDVPEGTRVVERGRVQGVTGEPPIQLSTTWVSPEVTRRLPILRGVDTGPGGMLSRIEELGSELRFEDSVSCRLPSPAERAELEIGPHQPVLVIWRRCYDQDSRIVEVTRRIVAGHRHELLYRYATQR